MDYMTARKRLQAAQPLYADFMTDGTAVRIRVVQMARHDHGEVTLRGINDERVRLHLSRVAFSRG